MGRARTFKRQFQRALEKVRAKGAESQPAAPKQSLWDAALGADRAWLDETTDDPRISLASIARGMDRISKERGEWAGMPMPLQGRRMAIAKGQPWGDVWEKEINPLLDPPKEGVKPEPGYKLVNQFWSWKWRTDVQIWITPEGKYQYLLVEAVNHLGLDFSTIANHMAWSLETEFAALATLRGLLSHHMFRSYLLTGMFIESSPKSLVTYIFRKLKPTVALRSHDGEMKIMAALCLHPVAYYHGSWAGALCPTDDVLAHLMLMRGDEAMFWRRANQHAAYRKEAGI